ncbi:MAG: sigma-70 family RNA polymerase sigma factor [Deltaproteobacteria bacterium]|nr:sigma-70 family RNA polymerase sigma factor [Deltaproteobacteria bacterium]
MTGDQSLSSPLFLNRLRNRDAGAIETVVKSYTEHLYRGALGLGFDAHLARELVQSVWTTFFDVVGTFEGRSHVRTFIFGILYNKASELRRENARFDSVDPIEKILESRFDVSGKWSQPPVDPEKFLMASQTMALIQKCLDSLPLMQRMAFYLKEIDEHGSSDICNILKVTVTNLGVLLYRARNRLRECIESNARTEAF